MNDYDEDPFEADQRTPPSDITAEQAVLGAMMSSRNAITDTLEVLRGADDFFRDAHQIIYTAILDQYGRGRRTDPITLAQHLREAGDLVRVGGAPALHRCIDEMPVAANAAHYAEIVRDCAILRDLLNATGNIERAVHEAKGGAEGIVAHAQATLGKVLDKADAGADTHVASDIEEYLDRLEQLQKNGRALGVPTGFIDLDALFGGFMPGQVIVVAARPAMGKSTLALDFLRAAAIENQIPSVLFSLEMGRDEIRHRLFSAQGRIALHHVRHQSGMTNDDWLRYSQLVPRITNAPLHIDADTSKTVARIQGRCRALQQTSGLRLVVIDYLQLMQTPNRRGDNRQQEVADMMRAIKVLAMELEVPVVVLSQLNRGPEQRADKKPALSDLRESGAIEQDADIVILLHREDAYDKESPRAGEADLIVAKHRNGPTPTITVAFQGHYSRFVDMAQT